MTVNLADPTTIPDCGAAQQSVVVVVDTLDGLLDEIRNVANPPAWRCHAFVALDDALQAGRARGETRWTLTVPGAHGRAVEIETDWPELDALALIWTPLPATGRGGRRAARRREERGQ
jgi:hypothetical protein